MLKQGLTEPGSHPDVVPPRKRAPRIINNVRNMPVIPLAAETVHAVRKKTAKISERTTINGRRACSNILFTPK